MSKRRMRRNRVREKIRKEEVMAASLSGEDLWDYVADLYYKDESKLLDIPFVKGQLVLPKKSAKYLDTLLLEGEVNVEEYRSIYIDSISKYLLNRGNLPSLDELLDTAYSWVEEKGESFREEYKREYGDDLIGRCEADIVEWIIKEREFIDESLEDLVESVMVEFLRSLNSKFLMVNMVTGEVCESRYTGKKAAIGLYHLIALIQERARRKWERLNEYY